MKKHIKNLLFISSLLLNIVFIYIYVLDVDDKEELGSNIAIMVYDEALDDYVKHDDIPVGEYELNEEKTTCAAGGQINGYNSELGTISYNLNVSDECYVYIDKKTIPLAVRKILEKYPSQGDGGLYLHDSTLANGANDGSYRFSGTNPDNYVCFDENGCTDDTLYRIIGIFEDNIKVIKYKALSTKYAWDSNNKNIWEGSSLEVFLNNEYIKTLGSKASLIADYTWSVGGVDENTWKNLNVKAFYDKEMNYNTSVTRKIGVMYASEYGYAATNNYWTTALSNYKNAKNYNWMYVSGYTWTITRDTAVESDAYHIHNDGHVLTYTSNNYVKQINDIRPSFYLIPDVDIKAGDGSYSNPYIIIAK